MKRALIIFVFLVTGFFQAAEKSLHIEELVSNTPFNKTEVAALFVYADSGEEIFSHNAEEFWIPASNTKLFTTAAALYYLGPDYEYLTTIYTNGIVENGTLKGDLIIRGQGDPSISARFFPDSNDPRVIFFHWSDELKNRGIESIEGNIIADDRYFDDQYFHPYWYPRSRAAWYQAEVSALSFNDNCIDITFRGGSIPDERARFSLSPPTRYVEIENQVVTASTGGWGPSFQRNDLSNYIIATGSVGIGRQNTGYATVYNPSLYFVTVLKETLEESGINVSGSPLSIRNIEDPSSYEKDLKELIQYSSPPMSELIYVINQRSQNLFAELLLKTLGKEVSGQGSFEKGGEAVRRFLKTEGLYQENFAIIDGSGLSNRNRFSPRMIVDLLHYMRNRDDWDIFFKSLPQGGQSGSLRSRFRGSDTQRQLGDFIYGKTGYINKVITLSGIISGHGGEDIYYSIFLNNFDCTPEEARHFADHMAVTVLESVLRSNPQTETIHGR